jgi:serine/threonine protein kinase
MAETVRFQQFEVLQKEDGSLYELGRGAMGTTYKALDTNLCRHVALKVIKSAYLNSEAARQRFLRKARAAMALRHPNVATVYHLGREANNYFYAMEFVDGETVEAFVKREGAVPTLMALKIAAQVARALGAAQEQGLVYSDIKPSSVMFVRYEGGEIAVKVIDFGFAKNTSAEGGDSATLTTGGLPGTPHFASPEQLEEGEIDARSGIYSLGATLWYMLSGKTPFSGTTAQVMSQHLHRDAPFETLLGQPAAVVGLLRRMMAKNSDELEFDVLWHNDDRPQTPGDLRRELDECVEQIEDGASPTKENSFEPLHEPAPPAEAALARPYLDENVQFTVFRPGSIEPLMWHPLVAFAHLSAKRPDAPEDEPDPVEEVQRQARAALQEKFEDYQNLTQDSSQGVPREGEISFVPLIDGLTFNPPRRTFLWTEPVHREEFRMRTQAKPGQTLRGSMSVFLGRIILAEIKLTIRVASPGQEPERAPDPASATRYRKIFASYSHKDHDVVEQFARLARAFGDEYLRDLTHLRAGEVWDERLLGLIEEADVFQLLWSSNSMRSPYVRREWEHALSLRRRNFIRPTYWEQPMPVSPAEGLPPEELLTLQFIPLATDRPGATAEPETPDKLETPTRRSPQPAPLPVEPIPKSTPSAWDPLQGRPAPAKKRFYPFSGLLALTAVLVIGGILLTFSIPRLGNNPSVVSDRVTALEESVRTSAAPSKVLPELVSLVNAPDPALAGPADQERLARAAIALTKRLKNVAIENGSNELAAQASEAAALAETAAKRSGSRDIEREVFLLQHDMVTR